MTDRVLSIFKEYQARAKRETVWKLKVTRANNGREYRRPFKEYCWALQAWLYIDWWSHWHYAWSCISIGSLLPSFVVEVLQDPISRCRPMFAFFFHGFHPFGVTSRFRKAFKLLFGRHLHHEGIMVCQILIVTNSGDRILLSGRALKFSLVDAYTFTSGVRIMGTPSSL